MNKPLLVHPSVAAESQAAYDWYLARSHRAALRFRQELERAYEAITADPKRFAEYPFGPGRYRQLHKFPYIVIYLEREDHVGVFAVVHTSRMPGYWTERIDEP